MLLNVNIYGTIYEIYYKISNEFIENYMRSFIKSNDERGLFSHNNFQVETLSFMKPVRKVLISKFQSFFNEEENYDFFMMKNEASL